MTNISQSFNPRPMGRPPIKRDLRVELPRPRDSASAAFNALKRDLSALVTAEQHRFEQVELKGLTTD